MIANVGPSNFAMKNDVDRFALMDSNSGPVFCPESVNDPACALTRIKLRLLRPSPPDRTLTGSRSKIECFVEPRRLDTPAETLGKLSHGELLAMNEECYVALNSIAPGDQLRLVRMRREAVDRVDMRTNGNILAEELNLGRPIDNLTRRRAKPGKADEYDR